MDWPVVLSRFRDVLPPGGFVAIVEREEHASLPPEELQAIITRFSTNRGYEPYDLVDELVRRSLFQRVGEARTRPLIVARPVAAFVESFHSRNGFSRDRMSERDARDFDASLRDLVERSCGSGPVAVSVTGVVTWGRPRTGRSYRGFGGESEG